MLFLCVFIAAAGILPTILGIGFLVLYIRNRRADNKPKKLGLILPSISLCIGEILSTPLLFMIGIAVLSGLDNPEFVVRAVMILLPLIFICGVISCVICAIRAHRGNPVGNKFFALSLILFFIGLYGCALHGLCFWIARHNLK